MTSGLMYDIFEYFCAQSLVVYSYYNNVKRENGWFTFHDPQFLFWEVGYELNVSTTIEVVIFRK